MAVSLALLGYGASGSILAVFPVLAQQRYWAVFACAQSIATLGAYLLSNALPFDSYSIAWDVRQVVYPALSYAALVTPFFFAGLVMGAVLSGARRWSEDALPNTSSRTECHCEPRSGEESRLASQESQLERDASRAALITSCSPGWIKFAEHFYPKALEHVSSCKSPQQMLGALCKATLPQELGIAEKDLVVVSIMPCTAKEFEAKRPEFAEHGIPEVDHVLTTQELARMIEESGMRFTKLEPESYDMPMGFKTGAGVIFGNSGGVSEAVLRYAAEKVSNRPLVNPDFHAVRGEDGLRVSTVALDGVTLKLADVHGLKNACVLAEKVKRGECDLDLIEVMACPGGCLGGAGQPVSRDPEIRRSRTRGLYDADKNLDLHKSQENLFVTECYNVEHHVVGMHVQ